MGKWTCDEIEAKERYCGIGMEGRGVAMAARDAARMARVVEALDAIVEGEVGGCGLLSSRGLRMVFWCVKLEVDDP